MKIGVCGYYGVNNLGDEAILEALKYALGNKYPGAEIVVFGKGMQFPIGAHTLVKSLFRPKLWKKPLTELKTCDLFIIGGGGLFSDEEGIFVPVYWSLQGLIALLLNKEVICLGISIGRLNMLNRLITRLFLKRTKLITVRDESSFLKLKEWGIKSYNLSDLTFLLPYKKTRLETDKKYVVLSLRKFNNFTPSLYKIIAQACDEIVSKYGLDIRLLPFQNGQQNDVDVMNKIFDLSKNKNKICILEVNTKNIYSIIDILANAEVVIGMRLHSCILSSIAETPFIPLAYMQKVDDFWKNEQLFTPISLDVITSEILLNRFDLIWNDLSHYKQIADSICVSNRLKANRLMDLLDNL